MPSMKEPSPEARENVTPDNVETRAQLLPEEQAAGPSDDPDLPAEMILAESEERTLHPDPDDSSGGHRESADTADPP
jgi:hypothetical protein